MRKSIMIFLATIVAAIADGETVNEKWNDVFYQYRIPVVIDVLSSGLVHIPVDEKMITEAINNLEEMKYNPLYFAYNYVKVIETDENGKTIGHLANSGFYLVTDDRNIAENYISKDKSGGDGTAMFEEKSGQPVSNPKDEVEIPVIPGQYYFLSYTASGGGSSPLYKYEPIHPAGTKLNKYNYRITYQPRLLKQQSSKYEELFVPSNDKVSIVTGGRFIGKVNNIILKGAKIVFAADIKTPGKKYLTIYYQPMCSHYLMVPELRCQSIPGENATLLSVGKAQKETGKTKYKVASNAFMNIWFAETTVKLTPETPAPSMANTGICISAAQNERQSFQVILTPKQAFNLKNIEVSALVCKNEKISQENITIKAVDFVPVRKSSQITPAKYLGWIGDPLVPVKPELVNTEKGNLPFWCTVSVPANTKPGLYHGLIEVTSTEAGKCSIPIELTVYDFALPEFSPLQVSMGGQFFVKKFKLPDDKRIGKSILEYHGLKSREDLIKLSNAYYEEMARNKFYPKSAALYKEITMKWDAPPEGYNIDKPNNFFKLYDWDFTEFNKQLDYFINKLKVNQVTIHHTNPKTCKVFMHLPGKKLDAFTENAPMVTIGWQSFRESTYVAYEKQKGEPYYDKTIEISKAQYDRLLLDYFRAIAKNLEANGWLQYAIIMVDESHADGPFLHFLRLLKSDPLTAKIRVGVCVQGLSYFYYKEKDDAKHAYNGLLDFYIPQMDETYNRWEKNYFSDYGINPDRKKLWNYIVNSARWEIDVPGINNRIIGLDIFNRGGSGLLCWDTFLYDNTYGVKSRNPWLEPFSIGNGAGCFFYPPDKYGLSENPDFTITPSLRVETFREAVDDYEYAWLLENLIAAAGKKGIDTGAAEKIIQDINKSFHNSVHWSQNDTWLLNLRERLAAEIIALKNKINNKTN